MPFATQFALSLEVTRLVPLALTAANNAAQAVMNLARDLQNSGSDIVVEEDLANVFGRSRIAPQLASSFKTMILEHQETTPLAERFFIQSGPGPTVTRALKHPPYFSMVVQLSLLCSVHEKASLTQAITQALHKRLEGAPADFGAQAVPSQDGLLGVIRACQEQTASYDWNRLLSAVTSLLGMSAMESCDDSLSSVVLGGLLDMFAIVQSLPEDRLIYINDTQGICVLCVWAHHVLGLTVLVKMNNEQEIRMGLGNEQVIVDIRGCGYSSISLLDCDGGDVLITIKSDGEELEIDGDYRLPMKGYGRTLLLEDSPNEDIVEGMMFLAVAIALVVSGQLIEQNLCSSSIRRYAIDERKIFEVAKLLFDKPALTRENVNPYIEEYKEWKSAGRIVEPLPFFENWISFAISNRLDLQEDTDELWRDLLWRSYRITALILSFSHVRDLDTCANLPLRAKYYSGFKQLAHELQEWDGKSFLDLSDQNWFITVANHMVSHDDERVRSSACLLSDSGWSLFVNTFSDADPMDIDPGHFTVVRGVPCRHGVRKSGIVDGPISQPLSKSWTAVEKAGDMATLRCITKAEQRPIQVGEQKDAFVLSLRLKSPDPPMKAPLGKLPYCIKRTGYREYYQALLLTQRSRRCDHSPQQLQEIRLPPDSVTIDGFYEGGDFSDIRITILLTARSRFARWRALVGIKYQERLVLLRGNDCCFACVVDQAASQPGKWLIIL